MIVSYTTLDTDGNFYLDTSFLPNELALYRIHISKKSSPPASLIIGGKDENHLFLILNNKSIITIAKSSSTTAFHQSKLLGNDETLSLQKINEISRIQDSTDLKETQLKRQFIDKSIEEELRFLADTSSNLLVSLYALEKSNYKDNIAINGQFYKNYIKKWNSNDSSYFQQFKNNFPDYNESGSQWLLALILGVLGGILSTILIWKFHTSNKLKSLSVQERKVLEQLKEGKSNKEISEELNIGINTVKSHVSSVLFKLKLKSRKEILDLKI